MCGRYALDASVDEIASEFRVDPGSGEGWSASWNIAPSRSAPVIRMREGRPRIDLLRWGLIPPWSREDMGGTGLFNARTETIDSKPSFRDSFRHQRCIVPLRAFYEWTGGKGRRRAFAIRADDDRLFGLAGIWAGRNPDADGSRESFSIVTRAAGPLLQSIHPRMPVVLHGPARDHWLDHRGVERGGPGPAELKGILETADDHGLCFHRVSNRVGSSAHEGSDLLQELSPEGDLDSHEETGLFGPLDD